MERQRSWLRHVGMAGWTSSDDAESLTAPRALSISAAIFRYRLAGGGTASSFSEKSFAPTKVIPRPRTDKNLTSPRSPAPKSSLASRPEYSLDDSYP
jgi:hypothetical protein